MLTACGIETLHLLLSSWTQLLLLVATVLTACGIETLLIPIFLFFEFSLQQCLPLAVLKLILCRKYYSRLHCSFVATVLTACGIETWIRLLILLISLSQVATVLTACGIETLCSLQVLFCSGMLRLQQCLPLAVLKQFHLPSLHATHKRCCNSAYRLRYWNFIIAENIVTCKL